MHVSSHLTKRNYRYDEPETTATDHLKKVGIDRVGQFRRLGKRQWRE